jgi:hypothetical protein
MEHVRPPRGQWPPKTGQKGQDFITRPGAGP